MSRQPFTLLIHIALAIILAGAIVTHFLGIQGSLTLAEGDVAVSGFTKTSGPGDGRFPFDIRLISADIDFYPGTVTPMDFRSRLVIDGDTVTVSMNNVAQVGGWRFYQSGISPETTRLTVSYDPWGTGITYTGYILLFVGMAGFFIQHHSLWRAFLKNARRPIVPALFFIAFNANADNAPRLPAMQRPLAANLGKVYVYWNDRICPLQTMAVDVTRKLYGSDTYQGLTPEQILSGWLFYFDAWEQDYIVHHMSEGTLSARQRKRLEEQKGLVNWLGTGDAFKVYPYRTVGGHMEWLSLTGRRPSEMELEQWKFMQTTMPSIKSLLLLGCNIEANNVIDSLIAGQIRYAGRENLPSAVRIQAERIYNRYARLLPPAMVLFIAGIVYMYIAISGRRIKTMIQCMIGTVVVVVLLYMFAMLASLWWIGDHIPLSNGPEMMLFMSFFALLCSVSVKNRMLRGAFLIVASITLFVGAMGDRTPRIGMLMPVLSSPLLSVHVMLVMTSYVFFLIMAILAAIALSSKKKSIVDSLCGINRVILVPAVFLLAAGIFVGAIWANQSWGRYWGWDPKETCALVMLLIYSVPVHMGTRRLRVFRNPRVLHWYLLCAVLSVVFTYFGANYFLTGLHSYA